MEGLLLPDDQSWNPVDYRWNPHDLVASRSRLGQPLPSSVDTSHLADNGTLESRSLVLQPENLQDAQALRKNITCQVCGCGKNLENEKSYYKRYRLCEDHLKMLSLVVDGRPSRFCQQCGRFHPLSEFDGDKRSCRARLQEHNARRRKKQPARDTSRAGTTKRQPRRVPASKTSSGTEVTRSSFKRARTSDEQGAKGDKRNNSEDSTCQMETEDEDSEHFLEAANGINTAAAASPHQDCTDPIVPGPPRAASTKSELLHVELPLSSGSPEAAACMQHHQLPAHPSNMEKILYNSRSVNACQAGLGLSMPAQGTTSCLQQLGFEHTNSFGITEPDMLEGLESCVLNNLNMLDEVLLARVADIGRTSKAGPLDQLYPLHNQSELMNLRRQQQYQQALNGFLQPLSLNPARSAHKQSTPHHQFPSPTPLGCPTQSSVPTTTDLFQTQLMQPLHSLQHGDSLAATPEARHARELFLEMSAPKEQSLLERAHALQAFRLQAMSSGHDCKVEDGYLLHNDLMDLSTLLNLNFGRGRADLGLGLGDLNLGAAGGQLPSQRSTGMGPEWALNQPSTMEVTKSLLSGGNTPPQYQSPDILTRLSVKIYNCLPDQLDPSLRNYLMMTLSADSAVLNGTIRQGCVHLTLDISSPAAGGCPVQPVSVAGGLGPGMLENRQVLVQVGSALALFDNGVLVHQCRSQAPKLQRVEPMAVLRGAGSRLTVHGVQVCDKAVILSARFQGQVVPVTVVESVVEDEAAGVGYLVVDVPALPRAGVLMLECMKGVHLSNFRAVLVAEEAQVVREVLMLQAEMAAQRMAYDTAEHVALDLGRILEFDDLAFAQFAILSGYPEQAAQVASGTFVNWQRTEPKTLATGGDAAARKSSGGEGEDSSDSGYDDIPPELAAPPHNVLTEPYRSSLLHAVEVLLPCACEWGWATTASRLVGVLRSQGYDMEQLLQPADDGLSLLHRCVRSGQVAMVREALEWTSGTPCVEHWGKISSVGVSPLHLAAAAPNRDALGEAILSDNAAFCYMWLYQQAADGLSPAELAVQHGNQGLNELARSRLVTAAEKIKKVWQQMQVVEGSAASLRTTSPQAPAGSSVPAQQRSEVQPEESRSKMLASAGRQREASSKAEKGSGRSAMADSSKAEKGSGRSAMADSSWADAAAGPSGSSGRQEGRNWGEAGAGPSSSADADLSDDLPEDYEEEDDDCCKGSSAKDVKAQQATDTELLALGSYGLGPVGMAYLVCFLTLSAVLLISQLLLSSWGTCLLAVVLTLFQVALAMRLPLMERCRAAVGTLRQDLTMWLGTYLPAFPDQKLEAAYMRKMASGLVQLDLLSSAAFLAVDLVVFAKAGACIPCGLAGLIAQLSNLSQDPHGELSWLPSLLPHATIWLCTLLTMMATTQCWYVVKREQLMLMLQVLLMLAMRAMVAQGLAACWQRGTLLFLTALLLPVAFRVRVRTQVWIAGWALASSIMATAIADTSGLALLSKVALTTCGSVGITYILERNDRAHFLLKNGATKLPGTRPSSSHQHRE